jgi:hypothetical protein
MKSTLAGECKVAGPDDARGRPQVINDFLVGCEVCVGWVGFWRWLPELSVFGRVALEGGSGLGCRDGGQMSRSGRGLRAAVAWCPVWKAMRRARRLVAVAVAARPN